MGEGVLDVEVVGVVEDGDGIIVVGVGAILTTGRGDRDSIQRYGRRGVLCGGGHVCGLFLPLLAEMDNAAGWMSSCWNNRRTRAGVRKRRRVKGMFL